MKELGRLKWQFKGTSKLDKISITKLKRLVPEADHVYWDACFKYRQIKEQEVRIKRKVRLLKTIRERVRSEWGRRKAEACPCHVLTNKCCPNIICLARKRTWTNGYRGEEFYFWICSTCRMGIDYKNTKAMMAKLTGEYKNYVEAERI